MLFVILFSSIIERVLRREQKAAAAAKLETTQMDETVAKHSNDKMKAPTNAPSTKLLTYANANSTLPNDSSAPPAKKATTDKSPKSHVVPKKMTASKTLDSNDASKITTKETIATKTEEKKGACEKKEKLTTKIKTTEKEKTTADSKPVSNPYVKPKSTLLKVANFVKLLTFT